MGPHYFIHQAAGASLSTPPTTAFTPSQIRHAYGFDLVTNQGAGQTIALVDAYDDANAANDLAVFSKQFNLPACTTASGCFRQLYSSGRKPAANANWAVEISLDIEWAHAIAPQAKILLVEAPSNNLSDLLAGVDFAVRNGASVVSMSWTSAELSTERNLDNHFVSTGVTFLAASGDSGAGVNYPAASPDVIAVGGTSLTLDKSGNYSSESAWSGSGGGLSKYEYEPVPQAQFPIANDIHGTRGVPDVSYNANPGTGYAIYDSIGVSGYSGWFQVGGTSAATPQWAALIAITNSQRVASRKANLSATGTSVYAVGKSSLAAQFSRGHHRAQTVPAEQCAMRSPDTITSPASARRNPRCSSQPWPPVPNHAAFVLVREPPRNFRGGSFFVHRTLLRRILSIELPTARVPKPFLFAKHLRFAASVNLLR